MSAQIKNTMIMKIKLKSCTRFYTLLINDNQRCMCQICKLSTIDIRCCFFLGMDYHPFNQGEGNRYIFIKGEIGRILYRDDATVDLL